MNSKSKELTHNIAVKSIHNIKMTIHHKMLLSLMIDDKMHRREGDRKLEEEKNDKQHQIKRCLMW